MVTHKSPRSLGKITSWKEEQGFGFITPNGGGPAVFVHISAFADRRVRPAEGAAVTYYLTTNDKGQPRADEPVLGTRGPRQAAAPSAGSGSGKIAAAVAFLLFVVLCFMIGKVPLLVLGLYLAGSVVTYIVYAWDKSAARKGGWRTQESTLHLLALSGGWPGALVAQQQLRHKSKKEAFRAVFWCTVALNCMALGWLLSPFGAGWVRQFF